MKRLLIQSLGVAAMLLATHQVQAIEIDFSSVTNSALRFDAATDSFQFVDGDGGRDIRMTLSTGVGDSINLLGNIGGTFTIGPIFSFLGGQIAGVSGVGSFSIFDGSSFLTATLMFDYIFTSGGGGGMGFSLTDFSYSGTNADLLALAAQDGTGAISFQFVPGMSLLDLTIGDGINDTSYSGSLYAPAAVPEGGATLGFLAFSLILVEVVRRKLRLSS